MDAISAIPSDSSAAGRDPSEQSLALLQTPDLLKICGKYEADERCRREAVGLNVFTIVSNTYYRENFHSDIWATFLDRNKPHGGGAEYFRHFLAFLKACSPQHDDIPDADAFGDYVTEREKDRIDVGIRGEGKNQCRPKAIIIENKIYKAIDQPGQLPRYYNELSKDFDVVAVVYLSLCGDKTPDKSGWSAEDRESIDKKLICVGAFTNGKGPDLLTHWIQPCIVAAENIDAVVILRQYGKLLRYLGADIMNSPVMGEFWKFMRQGGNYGAALTVRDLVQQIPEYLASKTRDKYQGECRPFDKTWVYADTTTVFAGLKFGGATIAADLEFQETGTTILTIFDCHRWDAPEGGTCVVQELLQKAGLTAYFEEVDFSNGRRHLLTPAFTLPAQEDELHRFLSETFLPSLQKATTT